MDVRICWKCQGLSPAAKWTSSSMDSHTKQCPGLDVAAIGASLFHHYACDKTDFLALLEIKQALDKDVRTRLNNRKSTDATSEADFLPEKIIRSLLKLSISKAAEASKHYNNVSSISLDSNSIARSLSTSHTNISRFFSEKTQISVDSLSSLPQEGFENYSQQNTRLPSSSLVIDLNHVTPKSDNVPSISMLSLTDEEISKLKRECDVVKKENYEEFVCRLCKYQSKSSKLMVHHLNSHNNGLAFNCKECRFSTTSRCAMDLHQSRHKEGNFQCQLCTARFQSQNRLDSHLTTVHSERLANMQPSDPSNVQTNKLSCNVCDYYARDQASLKEHQRKHTGEHLSCPKEDCDFKTLYKRSLQKHLQQKHAKEKNQICEICGFQTRHISSLSKHMKLHTDSKQYKCSECSFASFVPSEIVWHRQRKHQKQKYHSCPKCDFRTGYLLGLKKHLAHHDRLEAEEASGISKPSVKAKKKNTPAPPPPKKEKYFCCSVCGDLLSSLANAKEHIQNFHCTPEFLVEPEDARPTVSAEPHSVCMDDKDKTVDVSSVVSEAFGEKNMNFDNLLDVDITNEVLDMANNILGGEIVNDKNGYAANNVDIASLAHHHHQPMCQEVFDDNGESPKSSVSRKGGNPMLSATSDVLADIDSSLLEESLFDLMSDLPRPPTLNRCQSASTLMFASLSQHMVDRPLTPDFFTDIPAQSFFQNFSARNLDQDNFPVVGSLNQSFQMSAGFPSQMDLSVASNPSISSKPLSPVLPNFTCFPSTIQHTSSEGTLNLPTSSGDAETAITQCLL